MLAMARAMPALCVLIGRSWAILSGAINSFSSSEPTYTLAPTRQEPQNQSNPMTQAKAQRLYIITGASRGLGHALALELLQPGHRLLTLSRQPSQALQEQAAAAGCTLVQWPSDLADATGASAQLATWLHALDADRLASATLVNNAGMIPPITPLRNAHAADMMQTLRVGLEAAMLLTAAFLRATADWHAQRRVLNISSGLGRRPMAAQAPYCAAKAGMDLFTHCVALEEADLPNGARACSLAPGVIATDMQRQLRSADPQAFPDHAYFQGLHDSDQLAEPAAVAQQIAAFLEHPDFGRQPVASLKDLAL